MATTISALIAISHQANRLGSHQDNGVGPWQDNGVDPRAGSLIGASAAPVAIFAEDSGLLRGVSSRASARLSRIRVPVVEIDRGAWTATVPRDVDRHFGLLMLDGLALRRVTVEGRKGAELLGGGDLLQPWVLQPPYDTLAAESTWEVLEQARFAVLDHRFAAQVAPWPEIAVALVGRAIERTRVLAFQHVASHIPGLERRLLALLLALADRWGKVTRDGVLIPLRLTHTTLAELVGASRPSVSTALAQLARQGTVERSPCGWLLAHAALRDGSTQVRPKVNGHRADFASSLLGVDH